MKKNQLSDLHQQSIEQLTKLLAETQLSLAKARLELKAGKLTNVSSVKIMSDQVARIKTIISEQELVAALQTEASLK